MDFARLIGRSFPRRISPAGAVFLLTAMSILLGVIWMFQTRPMPFSDFYDYYNLAQDIVDHHQFGYPEPTARRLPAYPALLAVALLVSRSFLWLGLVNIVLVSALVPAVHWLTRELTGHDRTALVAAALCALNPTFVFFSPVFASEHLFVLLFISSVSASVWKRPGVTVRAVLAGGLLGLALLTRGESVFYAPVVLYGLWTSRGLGWRRRIATVALASVVCVAVALPWAIRNRAVLGPGAGLSTSAGINFYYAHNPTQYGHHEIAEGPMAEAGEVERQRIGFHLAWDYLSVLPYRMFKDVVVGTRLLLWQPGNYALHAGLMVEKDGDDNRRVIHVQQRPYPGAARWLVAWFYRVLLICTVGSLFLYPQIGRRAATVLFGIVVMNWLCYSVVFWSKPRFRYVTEAVFCVLAGIVLTRVWDAARRRVTRSQPGSPAP